MTKKSKPSGAQTLTVGQIAGSNDLMFYESQNALGVAAQLLAGGISGAPVVNGEREFIGFISEFDVLNALEAQKELMQLTAADIMTRDCVTVTADTPLQEAVRVMKDKHLLNLPVIRDRKLAYTVTRHDLLRAWLGVGIDWGIEV